MIVYRSFGDKDYKTLAPGDPEEVAQDEGYEDVCFNRTIWDADAIFVAPDELHAIAWGLCLDKHSIECLEVACIRNRDTLAVVEGITPTIVHATLSGRCERFRELCLHEAVVLEGDIIARYRVMG